MLNIFLTPTQTELGIGSYLNKVSLCQFYICWSKYARKERRRERKKDTGRKEGRKI